jgi:hypothetical protein
MAAMCIQCAAGAMTAVAGASGARLWVEARVPGLMGPRTKKVVRRSLVGVGLLLAGLLGGSGAAPSPATAAAGHPGGALVSTSTAATPEGAARGTSTSNASPRSATLSR